MITKYIPIPSNDAKIYRQILAVLNFISGLTKQELDVLAEIIKLNHEYVALPPDRRAKFILSTEIRKEMRELLKIEEKPFNGLIARLKKKTFMGHAILDEIGVLHPELLFKPDEEGFEIKIVLDKRIGVQSIPTPIPTPVKVSEEVAQVESTESHVTIDSTSTNSYEVPSGPPEQEEESFNFTLVDPNE